MDLPLEKLSNLIEALAFLKISTNRLAQYQHKSYLHVDMQEIDSKDHDKNNYNFIRRANASKTLPIKKSRSNLNLISCRASKAEG